jgi:hypothetical protein
VAIDLTTPGERRPRLHAVDFAVWEHVATAPAMRPSHNGRFQLFTFPAGTASGLKLLIGGSELPVVELPPGVFSSAVLATWSVDFLNASAPFTDWIVNLPVEPSLLDARVFHRGRSASSWQELTPRPLTDRPIIATDFQGPGLYLLVRRATP